MGCTPSAQQTQSGTTQNHENGDGITCDQNKNSSNCRTAENHTSEKTGEITFVIYLFFFALPSFRFDVLN